MSTKFPLFMPVQRYEIFCNSQPQPTNNAAGVVVYAGAKIRNFLQFTTSRITGINQGQLFMPVQRYEIFCNSQPPRSCASSSSGCLCRCKDTKFFAIHNRRFRLRYSGRVVYAGAKIRNFLQFTTPQDKISEYVTLFMPVQRYEIFCNSQLARTSPPS